MMPPAARRVTLSPFEKPSLLSALGLIAAVVFFGLCIGNAVASILG